MPSDLYTQQLLHYYKNPDHQGELLNATKTGEASNVSCGDHLKIFLQTNNGIIKEVRYLGDGCIVSQASAEILSEFLTGRTIVEIDDFTKDDFLKLLGFELTSARQKCALIIFDALKTALQDEK